MYSVTFETWFYRAALLLVLTVIWYVLQRWATNLMDEIKAIRKSLTELSQTSALQQASLLQLTRESENHEVTIKNIENRLRDVEITQDRCASCKASN